MSLIFPYESHCESYRYHLDHQSLTYKQFKLKNKISLSTSPIVHKLKFKSKVQI